MSTPTPSLSPKEELQALGRRHPARWTQKDIDKVVPYLLEQGYRFPKNTPLGYRLVKYNWNRTTALPKDQGTAESSRFLDPRAHSFVGISKALKRALRNEKSSSSVKGKIVDAIAFIQDEDPEAAIQTLKELYNELGGNPNEL